MTVAMNQQRTRIGSSSIISAFSKPVVIRQSPASRYAKIRLCSTVTTNWRYWKFNRRISWIFLLSWSTQFIWKMAFNNRKSGKMHDWIIIPLFQEWRSKSNAYYFLPRKTTHSRGESLLRSGLVWFLCLMAYQPSMGVLVV